MLPPLFGTYRQSAVTRHIPASERPVLLQRVRCLKHDTLTTSRTTCTYCTQVLFEDSSVNRMQESLALFTEVAGNPVFEKTPMFVFLNKKDLFEEMIATKVRLVVVVVLVVWVPWLRWGWPWC